MNRPGNSPRDAAESAGFRPAEDAARAAAPEVPPDPDSSPETESPVPSVRRRRGVYLLPNLFTTGVLFSGFYAVVSAINGGFIEAAIAVYVAMVLDGLDGRVARLTNTQSDFGAEYDSLSDLVAFGIAPALIAYLWQLHHLGNLGWVAAFFYATTTALRLARFNSRLALVDKRFFQGLPSPASAAVVVGMVWVLEEIERPESLTSGLPILTLVVTVLAGVLMVSNLAYSSFKDMDFRHRVPFFAMIAVVGALMLTALDPAKVLLGGFVFYALSGPIMALGRLRRRRARKA